MKKVYIKDSSRMRVFYFLLRAVLFRISSIARILPLRCAYAMTDLGVRLYFAAGSDRNIKLTTPGDIEIFKGMLGL